MAALLTARTRALLLLVSLHDSDVAWLARLRMCLDCVNLASGRTWGRGREGGSREQLDVIHVTPHAA